MKELHKVGLGRRVICAVSLLGSKVWYCMYVIFCWWRVMTCAVGLEDLEERANHV
jgi:hypothetical protein